MNHPPTPRLRKLLIFAHTPPPHHGQSYMVQQVRDGLGGDARRAARSNPPAGDGLACYHVNCRFSRDLADIGRFQWLKPFLLFRYGLEAVWCRVRHGATDFLYVPAPPRRVALYRDWLILLLARLVFRRRVYYWQAAGLGEWTLTQASALERWITRRLFGRADLSIVLSRAGRNDGEVFGSRRIEVIPNFIPDPCPDFESSIQAPRLLRQAQRLQARDGEQPVFRVLFMALATESKGLFDAVEAVALANRRLQSTGSPVRVQLDVAGGFWQEAEQRRFDERIRQPDLRRDRTTASETPASWVCHHGFVSGETKRALFAAADGFCLPTFYEAEGVPLVLIEAMAYGLPVVTTRWRSLPDLFPAGYPGLVAPHAPGEVADVIERWVLGESGPDLRPWYAAHYTAAQCLDRLRRALAE